ncbi:MAG TPA: SLC13 family permease [Chondromyces sp.]|nr:SLC13 family permease [Chondromyces sp.]
MTWTAWFALGLTALVIVGLARNLAADALLWAAVLACGLAGILSLEELFVGFTNTGMLTIAALYVVAAGVGETGALELIGRRFLGGVRTRAGVMARLGVAVPTLSAFLNNTPVVAMFIPMLARWCAKHRIAPSRLLIPLSYMSILGGMTTLIGTSTNLVVHGMMADAAAADPALADSLRPMGLFEIGAVGLPCAVLGIAYLVLASGRLLPDRTDLLEAIGANPREYLVEMEVTPSCRLAGLNVEEAGLRHLHGLYLSEIIRDGQLIAPVQPDHLIAAGDVLTFSGVVGSIVELDRIPGLVPVADPDYEHELSLKRERMLSEAVVSPTSPLIGQSIRSSNFRAHYNAAVVAVHRGGARLARRLGDIVLKSGDTLLLQTGPHFADAHRNNRDFFLVSRVGGSSPPRHDRAVLSLVLLGLLVALLTSQLLPTVLAAFMVAALMIVGRCLTVAEARASLELQTLFAIAGAIALGQALLNSGAVHAVAHGAVATLGPWGPYAVLAGIAVLSMLFTEVVTNTAAAALMFPLAVATALDLGADPRPFVMVVALIASASFLTPIGYQTNLMVYGPGGYRFSDFGRVGLPLSLMLLVVATLLAPVVWPF